jgi:aspartate/methionine/tyrosine aminotransferase
MTRLQENLAILDSALGSTAAQRLVVEGGWYAVIEMPDSQTDENWAIQLLTECDVLVQPGFLFDFASESSLVVSLLTPVDVMATGVRRLAALM